MDFARLPVLNSEKHRMTVYAATAVSYTHLGSAFLFAITGGQSRRSIIIQQRKQISGGVNQPFLTAPEFHEMLEMCIRDRERSLM